MLDKIVDEEISIGDYVLTGGELPALVVADAIARMCPGVLPSEECFQEESTTGDCWNIPTTPGPRSGRGRRCRRCSCPGITSTLRTGVLHKVLQ